MMNLILHINSKKYFLVFIITSILLLSTLPISYFLDVSHYNWQRFLQIVLLLFSIKYLKLVEIINYKDRTLLLILFSTTLFSSYFSQNKLTSFLYFTHYLLLFGLIGFGIFLSKKVRTFLFLLAITNIIVISISILNMSFYIYHGDSNEIASAYLGFSNIRFFNQFQVASIFSIIYFILNNKCKRLFSLFLFFNFILMFLTSARGAILSVFTVLILMTLTNLKLKTKKVLNATFKIAFLAIVFYIVFTLYLDSNELNKLSKISTSGRLDMWIEILKKINHKSILGYGPGSYFSKDILVSHPHNSLLQIYHNWGVAAFLTTLLLTLKMLRFFLQKFKEISILHLSLCGSVGSLLTYSLFSGVFVMPLPQTLLFIFIGLFLNYAYSFQEKSDIKKRLKVNIFSSALYVSYLFLVILSLDCSYNHQYGPNFWSKGHVSLSRCSL